MTAPHDMTNAELDEMLTGANAAHQLGLLSDAGEEHRASLMLEWERRHMGGTVQ